MAGGSGEKSMLETATWSVAAVCAIFVIISVLIEHGIESLGKLFHRRQNKAMTKALEKIKAELMILGFISLLLTVGTSQMAKICIPKKLEGKWVPCLDDHGHGEDGGGGGGGGGSGGDEGDDSRRKLLSYATAAAEDVILRRRSLAAATTDDPGSICGENKIPMISYSAAHQLHLFIFVLAVVHVFYSVILMALAQAKMKKWKAWESETTSMQYQFTNDPTRFRFAHQTSFVKRHSGIPRIPGIRWIVAFLRQFCGSISRVDYLTIRNGFINAHFAPNSKFDFHKYVKRCIEDDFKRVLGISIPLWFFTIVLLLLNVHRWYTFTWISLLPLFVLVLVGTKLELVIMEMARQIQDRSTVVRGAPVVEPTNDFFWFNRPAWILFLIHFTLFENAFQMAYYLWTWMEFKGKSKCLQEKSILVLLRVLLGVALQILCSYITFPLYTLVTQMGSHMKTSLFEEQTAKALKKWHQTAKDRKKLRSKHGAAAAGAAANADGSSHQTSLRSGETSPSQGTSPLYLLHKHSRFNGGGETENVPVSPRSPTMSAYYNNSDADIDELDEINSTPSPSPPHHHHHHNTTTVTHNERSAADETSIDFTFVKP